MGGVTLKLSPDDFPPARSEVAKSLLKDELFFHANVLGNFACSRDHAAGLVPGGRLASAGPIGEKIRFYQQSGDLGAAGAV